MPRQRPVQVAGDHRTRGDDVRPFAHHVAVRERRLAISSAEVDVQAASRSHGGAEIAECASTNASPVSRSVEVEHDHAAG